MRKHRKGKRNKEGREGEREGREGMGQVVQGLLGHGEASGFYSKEGGAPEVCVHRKGGA